MFVAFTKIQETCLRTTVKFDMSVDTDIQTIYISYTVCNLRQRWTGDTTFSFVNCTSE